MRTVNITRYEITRPGILNDFEEVLHSLQFKYNTNQLVVAGLQPDEITMAMSRAMKVCRLNGIEVAEHFRSLYVFDENTGATYCDWRMSRQGFTLVILNAPHSNTAIARWQWELVNTVTETS